MHALTNHTHGRGSRLLWPRVKERVKEATFQVEEGVGGVVPGTFSCLGRENETLPGQVQTQSWRRQIPSGLIPEPTLSLRFAAHKASKEFHVLPNPPEIQETPRGGLIGLEEVETTLSHPWEPDTLTCGSL